MTQQQREVGADTHAQNHTSPIRTLSSIGAEPSEWTGPTLHTHRPTPEAEEAAGDQPSGYLGPTSYSAIFRENKLGTSAEDFTHSNVDTLFHEYDIAKPSPSTMCNLEAQEHIDQGIQVLQRFPDKVLCERLIERHIAICDLVLPEQMLYHVHNSIWSTYGEHLSEPRSKKKEKLSEMSKKLCKTAMTPLSPSSSTKEWMESFSGKNLRWEILGNLFAVFGLAIMTISDWDPLFTAANTRNSYSKRQYGGAMRECAEACLALCNDVDSLNDFVVSIMSAIYNFQSFYEGDASKSIAGDI